MNNEVIEELFNSNDMRVERIFSNGSDTDWFVQNANEFVYILEGNAILEYEDTEKFLIKGDFEYIPKQVRHRVKATSQNCTWLCVFKKD
ncbi:cupin domain-containing protein [Caviibacter abscessus]|uniref:cupin domain-containing protein n=1 Tax=Caviibacter abscessus TaxID=1766719 RepID=UPI0008325ED0|nr:cupin domain-containing protein [Caviibacter abscessus]